MPVDISNLDRDIAVIKKRRGDSAIHFASEQPPVDRIPLDSPALMRITSGGIPLGRITRLWGPPSGGKSLLGWEIIRCAQNFKDPRFPMGLLTGYWNVEKQFEPIFTGELGVNLDTLALMETDVIEDIAREMQLLLGSIHVHVLDSASEAKPQDRLAKDPGDWDVGLKIRVWEKAWEYITNSMDKDENAIIVIDHASRDFITKSEKPLGGKEAEHQSSLSIQMKKTKWLYLDTEGLLQPEDKLRDSEKKTLGVGEGLKEPDGIEILAYVNKSRVCRALRKAHMRLDLTTYKFDHIFELMEASQSFDTQGTLAHRSGLSPIVKKNGSWYETYTKQKVQGERGLRLLLAADEELANTVKKSMMAGY